MKRHRASGIRPESWQKEADELEIVFREYQRSAREATVNTSTELHGVQIKSRLRRGTVFLRPHSSRRGTAALASDETLTVTYTCVTRVLFRNSIPDRGRTGSARARKGMLLVASESRQSPPQDLLDNRWTEIAASLAGARLAAEWNVCQA